MKKDIAKVEQFVHNSGGLVTRFTNLGDSRQEFIGQATVGLKDDNDQTVYDQGGNPVTRTFKFPIEAEDIVQAFDLFKKSFKDFMDKQMSDIEKSKNRIHLPTSDQTRAVLNK